MIIQPHVLLPEKQIKPHASTSTTFDILVYREKARTQNSVLRQKKQRENLALGVYEEWEAKCFMGWKWIGRVCRQISWWTQLGETFFIRKLCWKFARQDSFSSFSCILSEHFEISTNFLKKKVFFSFWGTRHWFIFISRIFLW